MSIVQAQLRSCVLLYFVLQIIYASNCQVPLFSCIKNQNKLSL